MGYKITSICSAVSPPPAPAGAQPLPSPPAQGAAALGLGGLVPGGETDGNGVPRSPAGSGGEISGVWPLPRPQACSPEPEKDAGVWR